MAGSVSEHLGIRNALGVVLMLASYLVWGAAAAAGQRSLEVIDLNSTSAADEASKARAAFAKGDAIVRMIGASPADFERLVGVRTGEIKAFSDKTQKPGAASRRQLKLQAVAAYVDGKGILRSLLSFAPDGDGWRKQMDNQKRCQVNGARNNKDRYVAAGGLKHPPGKCCNHHAAHGAAKSADSHH